MPNSISIVSIGAGNIAHHLIPALHNLPCNISQVYSRHLKNANHLAHMVDAQSINDLNKLDTKADLYLIMVPDDVIPDIVSQFPDLDDSQYIAHTSGATPSHRLKSIATNYGAFYALQSFKKNIDLNLNETPFLIYGNNTESLRFLRTLARKISPLVEEINDKERLIYHLCAVLVNNYTNHLACIAREILNDEKLDSTILDPILSTTFERIMSDNPCDIQTGPARRKDFSLQRRHLKLLDHKPEWQNLYKVLSKSINKMYNEDN